MDDAPNNADTGPWELTLTPVGDFPPPIVRLRLALKHLWRTQKLKCTSIKTASPTPPNAPCESTRRTPES